MAVFVLDKKHEPLMPCSEKRARLLLKRNKAKVHRLYPFTIRLVNRTVEESAFQPLRCKIDPGSKTTGIAIVREDKEKQVVVNLMEIKHRGSAIHEAMVSRASYRRRRRNHLPYRSPRFNNREKPEGWLVPSLIHRVENVVNWIKRLERFTPLTSLTCETVHFDTQKLANPEIQGVEYQKGTLFGYEIREYLLEKWGRKCVYCGEQNVPLQVDHIIPRSKGGSNRVDNLTLCCAPCNLKKSNSSLKDFAPNLDMTQRKTSFRDSAAVNSTRKALWEDLTQLPLICESSTGGQTKYNRERLGIPKTHALDAACTGVVIHLENWQIPTLQIISTGRGSYQRTRTDSFGFPRGHLMQEKQIYGFRTGDHVKATVTKGKKKGNYKGRVAIRASGYFNIQTPEGVVQGINRKCCTKIHRADGYHYSMCSKETEKFNINIRSGASSQS